ncbi:hypothetical protein H1C71_001803 [Ictidomys tridecemlineatus]|nr:hypothetical protein H1C71_001803 [Ictidomys tridecemlineatus]
MILYAESPLRKKIIFNCTSYQEISLYEDLGPRKERSIGKGLDLGGHQFWGEGDWPPQRIIATYGPTTWARDGSWGYRSPIYMPNRIIDLQVVLEIIINQTITAFDLLATQQTQMQAAISIKTTWH